MISSEGVSIVPIADAAWPDVQQVFGTRGDPARCWCQFFKLPNREWWDEPSESKEALLHGQAGEDPGPGLIAYLDGEPVGWCAIEPRPKYPQLLRSKVVTGGSAEPGDDPSVWAITCFVVRVGFRRRGVASALVAAAVDWARQHDARLIEGYPVDTAAREKTSAAALYHGSVSLFESAGFTVATRPSPGRAVMRLEC
jgi:GNAT superfamily N-acetyltransferase